MIVIALVIALLYGNRRGYYKSFEREWDSIALDKPIMQRYNCLLGDGEDDDELGDQDAHEHRQGIDRGIGYGRSVVAGCVVSVAQGGRVGGGTGDEAHDGAVVEPEFGSCHNNGNQQWDDGD